MSFGILLSVSTVNVLLNVFVICLVALGAEVAQFAIYKSTQLQLQRHGIAPVLTESDDILSRFRNRFLGARKSRSLVNLTIVLVSASLIFGEICSEFGVDASQRCKPNHIDTMGICADPFDHLVSASRMVATAYHTRIAGWNDKELSTYPVYEGLRKDFSGREAFFHKPSNKSRRIVVAGCHCSPAKRIEPNDASFEITFTNSIWKSSLSALTTPNGSQPMAGYGDVTHNGKTLSAFLVVPAPSNISQARTKIFEYHSKNHLGEAIQQHIQNGLKGELIVRNKEPMFAYNLWCTQFSQSSEKFASALQVYRSVQLEDSSYVTRNISIEGIIEETIAPMNSSDAVRAAITLAVMNANECPGETFEYTECGIYHWKFLGPLLILFFFMVIFAFTNGVLVMRRDANVELPHNSSAWSAVALRHVRESTNETMSPGTDGDDIIELDDTIVPRRGYYQLVEREDGTKDVELLFRRPPKKIPAKAHSEAYSPTEGSEAEP